MADVSAGRGRQDEALTAASALTTHPHPLIQATGHIEAGYALVGVGRWGDAAAESNTALKILRAQPEGAPMAATALLALQGEIFAAHRRARKRPARAARGCR